MNYQEIRNKCREGYLGIIPGWKGYLRWNYGLQQLQFFNGDYIMDESELKDKIKNRIDIYYII